ncbi:MAG: hypothetical protein ACRD9L_15175 [Bryobacteraceae bacterium]
MDGLIVCRKQKGQRLLPGYNLRHRCEVCRTKLQVSPDGVRRMTTETRFVLLCNDCGLALARRFEERGQLGPRILGADPQAVPADISPTGRGLLDLLRGKRA